MSDVGAEEPARGPSGPLAVLERWEQSGAYWRVAHLGERRARVDLLACTGERVDVMELDDPEAIAELQRRAREESPWG